MFEAPILTLVGLGRVELPLYTMRIADGGTVNWAGEVYTSEDPSFGVIGSVEAFTESSGNEAPGGKVTFLPKDTAAAANLSSPSFQGSRVRFWLAQVDPTTGSVTGTPQLVFDGQLDTTTLRIGKGTRVLDMEYMAAAYRLFHIEDGNVLSSRFHQSVWPGETGFDNATGVMLTVAWGIASPPRGTTVVGGGGGGGNGTFGGDGQNMRMVARD